MDIQASFRPELNFRDLGGYPGEDGRTVKRGLFFRSGSLRRMNKEERKALEDLGLHCVLDLRTETEAEKYPDPVIPGIVPVRISGISSRSNEEIDFSPKGMHQIGEAGEKQYALLLQYYCEMPFHNEAFHFLLDQVDQENVPICFHCATGKDRTGVAAMLLLLLLGVNDEIVLQDYMKSMEYRQSRVAQTLAENAEQAAESPIFQELLIMKEGVLEKVGRAVLTTIQDRYGSYDAYFSAEYGYDWAKIEELRNRYLE